ncbi:MAG: LytTR family DNA-binding domain-containing protein [Bacteroidia bacterium]|nr:LytTR family DNA-binding domain-containing protein [Bacteroidia bacterium]
MKQYIIIEDEPVAARRLKNMISEIEPESEMLVHLESVEEAVHWFQKNPFSGLICMDVNLADGTCFDILKQVEISAPVIFTTAFEAYIIQAFEANAIAYLLKPIKREELEKAIMKYEKMEHHNWGTEYKELTDSLLKQEQVYIKRLLIKIGNAIRIIPVSEVAYFFTQNKIVYACLLSGKNYPVGFNLDEMERQLSPADFFRINRQFIVSAASVTQIFMYTKSRLKLFLSPASETEVIVSYERTAAFKKWLTEN